jgi:branched-chain amino acid transport system ATP-binding protein
MAKNLPHGHQKLLSIAMAIATKPELLLLDEPVAGMNQEETNNTMSLIKRIRDEGTTILIVEHNMRTVMELCDRIAVLTYGNKIAEGSPKEISLNEEVIRAYLGSEQAA